MQFCELKDDQAIKNWLSIRKWVIKLLQLFISNIVTIVYIIKVCPY